MFLVLTIPAFMVWVANEMPLDRTGISILLYGVLAGMLAGLKELTGWKES